MSVKYQLFEVTRQGLIPCTKEDGFFISEYVIYDTEEEVIEYMKENRLTYDYYVILKNIIIKTEQQ